MTDNAPKLNSLNNVWYEHTASSLTENTFISFGHETRGRTDNARPHCARNATSSHPHILPL